MSALMVYAYLRHCSGEAADDFICQHRCCAESCRLSLPDEAIGCSASTGLMITPQDRSMPTVNQQQNTQKHSMPDINLETCKSPANLLIRPLLKTCPRA